MALKWTTSKGSTVTLTVSGRNNVYLIESGGIAILVDAGMAYMYGNLLSKLERLGARPSVIALTHAHYDHAENTQKLREKFGAKVLVHEAEAAHLASGVNPEDDPFSFTPVMDDEHYAPVKPDIIAGDGYVIGGGMTVMHTPGHTPGSISAIVDNEIAAVGDTMFSVYPGQAMVPYVMDREILLAGWKRLFSTGCGLFLPAHGRPVTRKTAEAEYIRYSRR